MVLKRSVKSGAGDFAAGADRLRGGAGTVGRKQNRRLDGGDYLGLRVCADPGGVVNVDHPFALRSGGKKAGSIQVAVIQLANTCGAAVGGVALDHLGLLSPLVLSGILMLFTGLLVTTKVKVN